MSFSPSNYLQGLGWKGPGKGLTDAPHARSKPVIIAQKKTLSGVGKDRDQAFPWWEMVFATVASKGVEKKELHRTSTGIISNKPAPSPSAYASGQAPPLSSLNMDALSLAKMEAARRQLYSSFLRGQVLGGSADEEEEDKGKGKGKKRKLEDDTTGEEEEEKKVKLTKEEKKAKKEAKAAKKEAKRLKKAAQSTSVSVSSSDDEAILVSLPTPSSSPPPPSPKEKVKKAKKAKPPSSTIPYLSPEESLAAEERAYEESREAARRAMKEEKRLEKVVRKALKEKK